MKKQANWENSLQQFLKKWENRKEVIGAIVCGSYVTGNPSNHSDIDIHILLDESISWRERGNEIIDGILIEYFANPIKRHHQYLEEELKSRKRITAHMLCTWKILFDKTGELKKLVQHSKKYLKKKYPRQTNIQTEITKYHIWDMYDNLEEVFDAKSEEFLFVFYNCLSELFESYGNFLQFDSIPTHKVRRFLINEKDKKKYFVGDFPDEEFVTLIVSAMNLKDNSEMMKEYKTITNHVLEKMGGFDIDGWKINSPA